MHDASKLSFSLGASLAHASSSYKNRITRMCHLVLVATGNNLNLQNLLFTYTLNHLGLIHKIKLYFTIYLFTFCTKVKTNSFDLIVEMRVTEMFLNKHIVLKTPTLHVSLFRVFQRLILCIWII